MKKLFAKLGVTVAVVLVTMTTANAAAPVQIAFFDLKAPRDPDVTGVRFPAIYAKGGTVQGVDLQLLAFSEMDNLRGVSFPLLIAGANRVHNEMTGVAFGVFNWHEGQDTGVNIAFLNMTNNVKGAELGWVNISQKSNFQLAWVNVTQEIDGVQIGLLNCAKNGFLPCFPFVNFGSSSK